MKRGEIYVLKFGYFAISKYLEILFLIYLGEYML